MKPTADLIKILQYGASIVLDSSKPTEDIIQLARYVNRDKGARIVVKKAGSKPTEDLIKIAMHGAVEFDFTE